MIIYSVAPHEPFITTPGELVIYGEHEHEPKGFGEVSVTPEGTCVVNGKSIHRLLREFPWVRKVAKILP